MTELLFYPVGLAGLLALCLMLIVIGRAARECPETAAAARLGALIITTGFATIGTGVIALIGAALPIFGSGKAEALPLALGFVSIALGVGFWNAASMLRDILREARKALPAQGIPA